MTTKPATDQREEWEKEFDEKFSSDIFYGVATFFKDEKGNIDRVVGKKTVNDIKKFISDKLTQANQREFGKEKDDN